MGRLKTLRRCARSHLEATLVPLEDCAGALEATLKSLWRAKALHRCARSHLGASKAPPRCARSHFGASETLRRCSRSRCARSNTLRGCIRRHAVCSKTLRRWKHCAGAFEVTVRSYCSRSLFEVSVSVSLHLEPLHPAPLHSEHGYARVHTSIYRYIYIY